MNYAAYCDALIEQMDIHEGLLVQLRASSYELRAMDCYPKGHTLV